MFQIWNVPLQLGYKVRVPAQYLPNLHQVLIAFIHLINILTISPEYAVAEEVFCFFLIGHEHLEAFIVLPLPPIPFSLSPFSFLFFFQPKRKGLSRNSSIVTFLHIQVSHYKWFLHSFRIKAE